MAYINEDNKQKRKVIFMKVRAKVNRLYLKEGIEYEVFRKEEDHYYVISSGILACVGKDEVEEVNDKAYALHKRHCVQEPTVAEIVKCLSRLNPAAKLHICGSDSVFLHVSHDGTVVNLDCSSLEEEYPECGEKQLLKTPCEQRIGKTALSAYDMGELYAHIFGYNTYR